MPAEVRVLGMLEKLKEWALLLQEDMRRGRDSWGGCLVVGVREARVRQGRERLGEGMLFE